MTAATRVYAPPGDLVRLTSDEPLVFELAGRLWERAAADAGDGIRMEILRARRTPHPGREEGEEEDFLEGAGRGRAAAPTAPRGVADPSFSFEESQRWVHEEHEFRCAVPGALEVTIDFATSRIRASLSPSFSLLLSKKSSLRSSSFSSFLARTLLEAPAAVLLGRRGWQVLHAGAVVGPRGAAVLRGPSGAGKSTLVAAAHAAGLGVLGDESVFVSRRDPDALAASVRDLALREDSARLLGIFGATEPAFTGREAKRRVNLFEGSAPPDRRARRARLEGVAFLDAFRAGAIPQERPGDAEALANAWAADGWLLSGASDL